MTTTPTVTVPRDFNIATEYIDGPIAAGHGARVAYVSGKERVTYAELQRRVNQVGNALAGLGVDMEQRVGILLPNIPEFVTAFFGAAKIGAVPTPLSTAVTPNEQAFLLRDGRARALVVSGALWAALRPRRAELPFLQHVLVVEPDNLAPGEYDFAARAGTASSVLATAPTTGDDVAFWLHTSGSTGTPKWAVHVHRSMPYAEQVYARPALGLEPGDVVLSGGPCFHAYPLGLTTYFSLRAGATVVLNRERSTPQRIFELIREHRVTVFAGVPTLYAQMLAAGTGPECDFSSVRLCLSAAEPLPAELWRRWRKRFGAEILDGIGTTEALHVFMSNRVGQVRPGSSGTPVPGYDVRLVDEEGAEVGSNVIGNLTIRGGTLFVGYWNRRDVTQRALKGEWYYTGDKYTRDTDGYYWYTGRADDMLRVSGHWVSPAEVEGTLIAHPAVLEAAVVGKTDADDLVKPKAFVILRDPADASERLAEELKAHVKATIAPYNYPRWIEFVNELPKTATGKIQRFKLRD
jgi:benzoate-CoA ligase family protein